MNRLIVVLILVFVSHIVIVVWLIVVFVSENCRTDKMQFVLTVVVETC